MIDILVELRENCYTSHFYPFLSPSPSSFLAPLSQSSFSSSSQTTNHKPRALTEYISCQQKPHDYQHHPPLEVSCHVVSPLVHCCCVRINLSYDVTCISWLFRVTIQFFSTYIIILIIVYE